MITGSCSCGLGGRGRGGRSSREPPSGSAKERGFWAPLLHFQPTYLHFPLLYLSPLPPSTFYAFRRDTGGAAGEEGGRPGVFLHVRSPWGSLRHLPEPLGPPGGPAPPQLIRAHLSWRFWGRWEALATAGSRVVGIPIPIPKSSPATSPGSHILSCNLHLLKWQRLT